MRRENDNRKMELNDRYLAMVNGGVLLRSSTANLHNYIADIRNYTADLRSDEYEVNNNFAIMRVAGSGAGTLRKTTGQGRTADLKSVTGKDTYRAVPVKHVIGII